MTNSQSTALVRFRSKNNQFFITGNLAVHGEDGKEGEKSLFAEGSSSINIAHALMSSAGWGRGEPPKQANEAKGEKPS